MEENSVQNESEQIDNTQPQKPVYKQWWFWTIIIFVAIIIISIFSTSNSSNNTTSSNYSPKKQQEQSLSGTIGELNALASAKNYLRAMAFSREGLINQLEYEGYSTSEATFAVNNCGADWYEQAAKCAKNYLRTMSFSRQGLIEQLEYEGFTHEQAVYGVEAAGY